ncbi:MAG: hypothetical protein HC836_12665 [Richelia sp. RM2_1_2]|nr:hypothetical protein [Richelia sp. RM2_1_2]
MWVTGLQKAEKIDDIINVIESIPKGARLTDEEARSYLARYFRRNLGVFFHLLQSKVKLHPMQEIILNGLFSKDNSLIVAGRGLGKSWLISIFVILYAIFHPNAKICLVANNFRRAREIFDHISKTVNSRGAFLLKQAFIDKNAGFRPEKKPDMYKWTILNGATIFALPLSNRDGLRGQRANLLIIDEALMVSKDIQENILRPFLASTAEDEVKMREEIAEIEDELIKKGEMNSSERTIFSKNKLVLMSSASFKFEYLYEIYKKNIEAIVDPKIYKEGNPSYFVARLSYETLIDSAILQKSSIEAAKISLGENDPRFRREYCAEFTDDTQGFYSFKSLHNCTLLSGDEPCVQIKGSSRSEYIIAIDPAYSSEQNRDYFAMTVHQIDLEEKNITQVHTYGRLEGGKI